MINDKTLMLIDNIFYCSASEPYLYLQVNLKPFGETGDYECYWEQNAQEVSTRQETGFPYKTPKLPGLIMNKVSIVIFLIHLKTRMQLFISFLLVFS